MDMDFMFRIDMKQKIGINDILNFLTALKKMIGHLLNQ